MLRTGEEGYSTEHSMSTLDVTYLVHSALEDLSLPTFWANTIILCIYPSILGSFPEQHECPSPMQLIIVKENRFECRQGWWFQDDSSSSICYEGTRILYEFTPTTVRCSNRRRIHNTFHNNGPTRFQHEWVKWKSCSSLKEDADQKHSALIISHWAVFFDKKPLLVNIYLTGLQIRE